MNNGFDLINIVAPSLTSSEYGKDIREQFENINNNFKILSNREFVKGDPGKSVYGDIIDLKKEPKKFGVDWIELIKNAVTQIFIEGHPNSDRSITINNTDISIFDDFLKNPGYLSCVCDSDDTIIEVMNYTFKDSRFLPEYLSDTDQYSDIIEYSCMITFNNNDGVIEASAIQTFPTLYYDSGLHTFCWKFNGVESGVIAKGPKGKDGKSNQILCVRINDDNGNGWTPDETKYKIHKVLLSNVQGKSEYIDIDTYIETGNAIYTEIDNNAVAIVTDINYKESYWISKITKEDNDYYVYIDDTNRISLKLTVNQLKETIFNILDSNKLIGLFIPISGTKGHVFDGKDGNLVIAPYNNVSDRNSKYLDTDRRGCEIVADYGDFKLSAFNGLEEVSMRGMHVDIKNDKSNINSLNNKINLLNNEIDDLEKSINNLNDKVNEITGIDTDITSITNSIKKNADDIKVNNGEISSIKSNISEIEKDITNIRSEIVVLNNKVNDVTPKFGHYTKPPFLPTYDYVICNINSQVSFAISNNNGKGVKILHTIFNNVGSSQCTISIPTKGIMNNCIVKNLTADSLTIGPGESAEVNVIFDYSESGTAGTAYIRSA